MYNAEYKAVIFQNKDIVVYVSVNNMTLGETVLPLMEVQASWILGQPEVQKCGLAATNCRQIEEAKEAFELGLEVEIPEEVFPETQTSEEEFGLWVKSIHDSRHWENGYWRYRSPLDESGDFWFGDSSVQEEFPGQIWSPRGDYEMKFVARTATHTLSAGFSTNGAFGHWSYAPAEILAEIPQGVIEGIQELEKTFAILKDKYFQVKDNKRREELRRKLGL